MKRTLVTISAVIGLGIAALIAMNPSSTSWADSPETSIQANERTQVFAVANMTCAACPFTVKTAMARVEGVKSVTVDFDAKTATAVFDPTAATVEDIANASSEVGYPATLIEG
ncbi:MAG: heavy metal-associated domain-containing protein [Gammaproteobacteria bacterium]|nr:heavy metal-associated domain-containing protein [Gammaproteobacteria bacterium]